MKKLLIFFIAIIVAASVQAQVTQLKVVNMTNCNIYYIVGGNYAGQTCPGNVTSPTYTAGAGSVTVFNDPSQAIWTLTPGDLLAPSDEIHFITFYNTDDPNCITPYTIGECGLPTSVGPIAIYDLANCLMICNPAVTATWSVSGTAATVVFN